MNLKKACQILGIEPTSDKNKIKKSYANKIKILSLKTDAEEFQKIRSAYEFLLKEIKKDGENIFLKLEPISNYSYATNAYATDTYTYQFNRGYGKSFSPELELSKRYIDLAISNGEDFAISTFNLWKKEGKFSLIGSLEEFETQIISRLLSLGFLLHKSVLYFSDFFNWKKKRDSIFWRKNDLNLKMIFLVEAVHKLKELNSPKSLKEAFFRKKEMSKLILNKKDIKNAKSKKIEKLVNKRKVELEPLKILVDQNLKSDLYNLDNLRWLFLFARNEAQVEKKNNSQIKNYFYLLALLLFLVKISCFNTSNSSELEINKEKSHKISQTKTTSLQESEQAAFVERMSSSNKQDIAAAQDFEKEMEQMKKKKLQHDIEVEKIKKDQRQRQWGIPNEDLIIGTKTPELQPWREPGSLEYLTHEQEMQQYFLFPKKGTQ